MAIPTWGTELKEVAPHVYGYVQGGGAGIDNTCVANAGFIAAAEGAMVIDALTVPPQTRPFISSIRAVAEVPIQRLVNTHHHNDHSYGNSLFLPVEIVSHEACRAAAIARGLQLDSLPQGPEWQADLDQLTLAPPTTTFDRRLAYHYGDTEVVLLHLGVAHTAGDTIVYLPHHKVLFAGDLVFSCVTPLGVGGSIAGWISVLDQLTQFSIDIVVPGHGPIGTMEDLARTREYLALLQSEGRRRFDAGMDAVDAAFDIDFGPYAEWTNPERSAANLLCVYAELESGLDGRADIPTAIAAMREYRQRAGLER